MKKIVAVLITTATLLLGLQTPARAIYFGTHSLDFLPIQTDLPLESIDTAKLKKLVETVDRNFNYFTGGAVRFTMGSIYPVQNYGKKFDNPELIRNSFDSTVVPTHEKAGGSIIVGIIPKDESIPWSGISVHRGNEILINGFKEQNLLEETLVHELGHSFDLGHSMTISCVGTGFANCQTNTYGDTSDVMGKMLAVADPINPIFQFSARRYVQSGLVVPAQIIDASGAGDYQITNFFPVRDKTKKVIYLGEYGRRAIEIQWRQLVGNDANLDLTEIYTDETRTEFYENIPSYGLQVRFVTRQMNDSETNLPIMEDDATGLYVPDMNGRQGLDPGQSLTLPNGVVIQFVSATNDIANVRVLDPNSVLTPITIKDQIGPVCTEELCYTGLTWKPFSNWSWKAVGSTMQFQEKIGKTWKTLKTIKRAKNPEIPGEWNFPFEVKVGKPGKHIYRFVLPASRGYATAISKPVTQTVVAVPVPDFTNIS